DRVVAGDDPALVAVGEDHGTDRASLAQQGDLAGRVERARIALHGEAVRNGNRLTHRISSRGGCCDQHRRRTRHRTDTALTPIRPGVASTAGRPPMAHDKIGRVQIGILGPFEVRTGDGVFADVPGARLRGLLVALALEPGRVVPKATLIDWIWGENPPSDAANALQRLVSRLRKVLPEGVVEGQPNGYRLKMEPDAVDAVRFEHLVGQARNDQDPR